MQCFVLFLLLEAALRALKRDGDAVVLGAAELWEASALSYGPVQ